MNSDTAAALDVYDFKSVRQHNAAYTDRTAEIHNLLTRSTEGGNHCLLLRQLSARGSSTALFLSTIKYLYLGEEELFRGLYIHNRWDWTQPRREVVHLDLSEGRYAYPQQTIASLCRHIVHAAAACVPPVTLTSPTPPLLLDELFTALKRRGGQTPVLLVEGYDTPVTCVPSSTGARTHFNTPALEATFSLLEDAERHLTLFTGVQRLPIQGLDTLEVIAEDMESAVRMAMGL
ncbi:hypothetical protein KIPB_005662 [Kipferlia bialata]|uniref:AAA-ATPase-like domain-containing protein n=1 Tax=Kipferlia bialata TaxID=797122 RepID=A0A9K3CVZ7_9EUKA|nr:hypothetical protein KIPB_005662 [Kipferlia bialata]|eukprot:g5662.t1